MNENRVDDILLILFHAYYYNTIKVNNQLIPYSIYFSFSLRTPIDFLTIVAGGS